MIDFPESTRIHQRMPKEAFYKRLELTSTLREKFVSDVDRIFVEYSLTMENLHLDKGSEVDEILLLTIALKKKEFDGKVVEAIARQNPHKLVFLLTYEDQRQLALYHGTLYRSPWMTEDKMLLTASGFSLKEIWDSFVEQIALDDERAETDDGQTLDQRLQKQQKILKMEKKLQKAKDAVEKEVQPKKKFSHFQKAQNYEKELEDLKHGQA